MRPIPICWKRVADIITAFYLMYFSTTMTKIRFENLLESAKTMYEEEYR